MRHLDDVAALTALQGNTWLGKQKVMSKAKTWQCTLWHELSWGICVLHD